jgi:hypothetical protein
MPCAEHHATAACDERAAANAGQCHACCTQGRGWRGDSAGCSHGCVTAFLTASWPDHSLQAALPGWGTLLQAEGSGSSTPGPAGAGAGGRACRKICMQLTLCLHLCAHCWPVRPGIWRATSDHLLPSLLCSTSGTHRGHTGVRRGWGGDPAAVGGQRGRGGVSWLLQRAGPVRWLGCMPVHTIRGWLRGGRDAAARYLPRHRGCCGPLNRLYAKLMGCPRAAAGLPGPS